MTKLLLTNAFNVNIPTLGLPCMYVFLWLHSSGTYTAPISMFFTDIGDCEMEIGAAVSRSCETSHTYLHFTK